MVRLCAEGKPKATTDKSVSDDDDDTAFLKMNDNNEMTNNLEAAKVVSENGGSEEASVETALNEQTMIVSQDDGTAVQEENREIEVEMPNEEYSLKEHKYNQTNGVVGEEGENSCKERNEEDATANSEDYLENGENMKEKNEGGVEMLNGGYSLKEDGYNWTDLVLGEEDENNGIDNSEDNDQENVQNTEEKNEGGAAGVDKDNEGDIMEEDAIGNNEDNNQENGQNTEKKNEGDIAGVDKDNKRDTLGKHEYEGNEEKNREKLEAITNQTTKNSKKGITRKRKANENTEAKGENKQVPKKVASEGKGKEYCGNLASKGNNDQDSKEHKWDIWSPHVMMMEALRRLPLEMKLR